MSNEFLKIFRIKNIVTLILTGVVAYKAIIGQMDIEQIYLMVIAFYFGTQVEAPLNINKVKKEDENK